MLRAVHLLIYDMRLACMTQQAPLILLRGTNNWQGGQRSCKSRERLVGPGGARLSPPMPPYVTCRPRADAGRNASADVTQQARDDLLADGRGGGTTVDAKIQRRLASTAAINQRMAALKRKRGAQQTETEQDADQPSDDEEEESDDEDAPLPGEMDPEDGAHLSGADNRH